MSNERTFIAVKPDGVQRGMVGEIVRRFELKGFRLVALKMLVPSLEQAKEHYIDLASKPFYAGLCTYFSSGPICGMVFEGVGAVKMGRVLLGATNPADSTPGSIRGDYAVDVGRNVCHGSDAVESAEREIAFWFPKAGELCDTLPGAHAMTTEKPVQKAAKVEAKKAVEEKKEGCCEKKACCGGKCPMACPAVAVGIAAVVIGAFFLLKKK